MARVFYSSIVDENLLIETIFWFLSPGIKNHIFCSEILKGQLLRQRSFQNQTENEMKFSENCLFSLMPRRSVSSEMGFLRSPNQLHQLLNWVLMCQLSSSIGNLGKTSFSENFMLLSNVNPTLTSFQKWFGRTTCSENIFLCRAIRAYLFSHAISILGIRCSVESKKVKPSFSIWISEGTTFLKSISVFDIVRWTFTCFRV